MLVIILKIVVGFVLGYISTVVGDYLTHRNIWHRRLPLARWRILRWWLQPHFVQHAAHHRHARQARKKLQSGQEVPREMKLAFESKYEDNFPVKYALGCSNHGMTIGTGSCFLVSVLLFVLTPHPIVVFVLWQTLGFEAGLPALLLTVLPFLAHINHRFYHMTPEVRQQMVPSYLRLAILNREFDIVAKDHQRHHDEAVDDCYTVLPFGRLILRPIFRRH